MSWDGGPAYWNQWASTKPWTNPAFFPIGVWYESVTQQSDVDLDKGAGLNTYFELTSDSDMSLIRGAGMWALPSKPITGYGAETVGWLLTDEADLWGHEGSDAWTGKFPGQGEVCNPPVDSGGLCGYTVLDTLRKRLPQDGRPHYQNLGFGLDTYMVDDKAAKFLDYSELASIDRYWYTDDGICTNAGINVPPSQCHLAASYGASVDRMRYLESLDGRHAPVFGFVEDGVPFYQFTTQIKPEQLAGAVMSELIHEARGIIYFNHDFGGPCISQHVLRDLCGAQIRPMVTTMNQRITELAPVLNTQSYKWTFNSSMDTMLKQGPDGSYYVFAMVGRGKPTGTVTLTLPPGLTGAKADVLYENRNVPIKNGTITDSFAAEYTCHIYRITP
ncbi:MAG TPA: hypothetical protein VGJ13_07370 [Pseudonocardiaceae bacterium]